MVTSREHIPLSALISSRGGGGGGGHRRRRRSHSDLLWVRDPSAIYFCTPFPISFTFWVLDFLMGICSIFLLLRCLHKRPKVPCLLLLPKFSAGQVICTRLYFLSSALRFRFLLLFECLSHRQGTLDLFWRHRNKSNIEQMPASASNILSRSSYLHTTALF